jgi:hypothetical protein
LAALLPEMLNAPFSLKLALMFIPTSAPMRKWRVQSSVSEGILMNAPDSGFPSTSGWAVTFGASPAKQQARHQAAKN